MYVALLGPLEVLDGARPVGIPGTRLGQLLTRLAVDAGRPVSVGELAHFIWADDQPADPANSLQSLVSRLRRVLGGPGVIGQTPAGYRLVIPPEQVDAHRFATLAADGRRLLDAGDPAAALAVLGDALQLWRGDGPEHLDSRSGLEYWRDLRMTATVDRATAALACGSAAPLIGDLEVAVAAAPFREDLRRLLIRSLVGAGRSAEALTVYESTRRFLADELGVDPSAETRLLYRSLLTGAAADPVPRSAPGNLRAEVSSLIGRSDDLRRITEQLERSRLVTILGPGGVGKTRLASRTGTMSVDRYPDGVWMVELASVTDESAIVQALLSGIGVRDARMVERVGAEPMGPDPVERLWGRLEHAAALIILDNCEHLIDGVARTVDLMLARCPELSVLATSREPLNIAGEALAVVAPLALPPAMPTPDPVAFGAVQLFVERALAVDPAFALDVTTTGPVVQIVRRLDGLPLAIELAAARLRVLPLSEIAARLDDRFRLLTGGSRTALPRHRTLRAAVEWSWDLMSRSERLLAERLAVFPAGATTASAQVVAADDQLAAADIPDLLDALVEKSILQVVPGARTRYRMLETIREFGIEQLTARNEVGVTRVAHARHFHDLARQVEPVLRTSHQLTAMETLIAERDNLLAALRYLAESGDQDASIALAMALIWFWVITGRMAESGTALQLVLSASTGSTHPDRMNLEAAQAMVEMSGRYGATDTDRVDPAVRMRDLSDRFEEQLRQGHDPGPIAMVLQPVMAYFAGLNDRGDRLVERAMNATEPWVRGTARAIRANFLENQGRVSELRREVEAAYTEFVALGDRWGLSGVLSARARLRTIDGDLDGATTDYERALECVTALQTSDDDILIMLRLADIRVRLGDHVGARAIAVSVQQTMAPPTTDVIRQAFAGATFAMVELSENGPAAGYLEVIGLRAVLRTFDDDAPVEGHVRAAVLATTAFVSIRAGHLDEAAADLALAYGVSKDLWDFPILAAVGVSVAAYALAAGQPVEAARILGASWALRGSDDPTDVAVHWVTTGLVAVLGDGFHREREYGRSLDQGAALGRLDPALVVGAEPAVV